MKIAEVQNFIAKNYRGVLVAQKKDGSPHITLVSPGIGPDGRVMVTSRGTTYKVKNIRRDLRDDIARAARHLSHQYRKRRSQQAWLIFPRAGRPRF